MGANSWEFEVVLDTHSPGLSDDLTKAAALIDERGARHAPCARDGAAPSGHHREGVLRFKPISPRPQSLELQIQRPGGSSVSLDSFCKSSTWKGIRMDMVQP